MIYIRDDDVLLRSNGFNDPVLRLEQIHSWILESPRLMHVPTILCSEIKSFPNAIKFIKEETIAGRMLPQLHGWEHIDYGKLHYAAVIDHLERSKHWMIDNLNVCPTRWYTPWGASATHLHTAANDCGLKLIDTSGIIVLEGPNGVLATLKKGVPIDYLDGKEIFMHWWTRGLRLWRLALIAKHGSWQAAKAAKPEVFK